MRFVCDNCKAKYSISDDKVRGKILKIRCKKCNNIIELRDPNSPSLQPGPAPSNRGSAPAGSGMSDLLAPSGQQQIAAVSPPPAAQQAPLGRGSFDDLEDEPEEENYSERTQISAPGLLDELRVAASGVKRKAEPDEELIEWFVAINDEPTGPVTKEQLRGYVTTGKVDSESLVWREGYDDWKPLKESAELRDLLRTSRAFFNIAAPPKPSRPAPAHRSRPAPSQPYQPNAPTAPAPAPAMHAPIAPPRQPEALRGQNVGRLGAPSSSTSSPSTGGLIPIPEASPAPPQPPLEALIPPPPAPIEAPAAGAPQPPAAANGAALQIPPPPAPAEQSSSPAAVQIPPPPAPAQSPAAAPVPSQTPASQSSSPAAVQIPPPPTLQSIGSGQESALATPDSSAEAVAPAVSVAPESEPDTEVAPLSETPSSPASPSVVPDIDAIQKPKRNLFIFLAGIAAILLGVVGAIVLIQMSHQSEGSAAQQNTRASSNEPVKAGMPPLVNNSLEIPMGGASNELDPEDPEDAPDAGTTDVETPPPAVSKGGSNAGGSNPTTPRGPAKNGNTSTPEKSDNLTAAQRRMLEQAKSLGVDSSTPIDRDRDEQGGSTAKRGRPLSSDQIRNTISKNRSSIQRCYEREMRGASGSGDLRVELRITVQPSGIVSNVQVSPSRVRGTKLATCMMSSARRWRFPNASAPSTFDAPFVLTPGR